MKYLLDSNVVIGLFVGQRSLVTEVRRHGVNDVAISAMVADELYFGACQSNVRTQSLGRVDGLQLPVLAFDRADAREAGVLRATLKSSG